MLSIQSCVVHAIRVAVVHAQVAYIEEVRRPSSAGAPLRSAAISRVPMSPTSSNGPMSPMRTTSDFPLRLEPTTT